MAERILSLDMSTKTGWAVMTSHPESLELHSYGQFPQMPKPADEPYPASYCSWAQALLQPIRQLIIDNKPDVIVIEETASGSKSNYSQKILEFLHYLVAWYVTVQEHRTQYFLTEEWRRICGCKMTKEESKQNKDVRDYKKKHNAKLAKNKEGKVIGRIGRKHINVRRANDIFGPHLAKPLQKKDEDTADALLLGAAYHFRKLKDVTSPLKGLRENGQTEA